MAQSLSLSPRFWLPLGNEECFVRGREQPYFLGLAWEPWWWWCSWRFLILD